MEKLTSNDDALIGSGKKLFVESIETIRNYSKFMISTSINAIPVYTAIIVFALGDESTLKELTVLNKALLISSPAVFLISMILFILAYNPKVGDLNLNNIDSIKGVIKRIIKRRSLLNKIGTISFTVGIITSIISIFHIVFNF